MKINHPLLPKVTLIMYVSTCLSAQLRHVLLYALIQIHPLS